MQFTIKRLLPVVVLPVALVAVSAAVHRNNPANAASQGSESRIVLASDEVTDRDALISPRKRPDLFIYSARTQGEAETKVFVQHRNGSKELVYVDQAPGELVDVSADGSHGVFRRFISPGKTETYRIDFAKRPS